MAIHEVPSHTSPRASDINVLRLAGLHLGRLLPALYSQNSSDRKLFLDVAGSCLNHADYLPDDDLAGLLRLHTLLLKDKNETCRLVVLQNLACCCPKALHRLRNTVDAQKLLANIARRLTDKSRSVRIKAAGLLHQGLQETSSLAKLSQCSEDVNAHVWLAIVPVLCKMVGIGSSSTAYCRETIKIAGEVLCTEIFRSAGIIEEIAGLIACADESATHSVILEILHFHLDTFAAWCNFFAGRSPGFIDKVSKLLKSELESAAPVERKLSYANLLEQAFKALEIPWTDKIDSRCRDGAPLMICIFTTPHTYCNEVSTKEKIQGLLAYMRFHAMELVHKQAEILPNPSTTALHWGLKALAVIMYVAKGILADVGARFVKTQSGLLMTEFEEEFLEVVYTSYNPLQISDGLLNHFQEEVRNLEGQHSVTSLCKYILLLGRISKSYQLASNTVIGRLNKTLPGNYLGAEHDWEDKVFDFMEQEGQQAQEQEAKLRFSRMLLEGDSLPACYVPFLAAIASADELPIPLRIAAFTSLGNFLLLSSDLSRTYKTLVESMLRATEPALQLTALEITARLISTSSHKFSSIIRVLPELLDNPALKVPTYCILIDLILQRKVSVSSAIHHILAGLADPSVKDLMVFLTRRLVEAARNSRHTVIVEMYRHASQDQRMPLIQTVRDKLLDSRDLGNEELALSVLQHCSLGQMETAFFLSFLSPTDEALMKLETMLNAIPPELALSNSRVAEWLRQFVTNHWQQDSSEVNEGLATRLLFRMRAKCAKKKRKQLHVLKT